MKLRVIWYEHPSWIDGGAWALAKGNGHLFLIAAELGRNPRVKLQLQALASRADNMPKVFPQYAAPVPLYPFRGV